MVTKVQDNTGTRRRDVRRPAAQDVRAADFAQADFPNPGDEYVHHPSFSLPDAEDRLWPALGPEIEVANFRLFAEVDDKQVAGFRRRSRLSSHEEETLFLRYNYAKYRLAQLTRPAGESRSPDDPDDLQQWSRRAREARDKLVHANLPLVLSMAKRMQAPEVELSELLSEGYMAVLRCVETFDVSRGFKFSTYACRSILAGFYRLAGKTRKIRQRFVASYDPDMEPSDVDERRHERQRQDAIDAVDEVLRCNLAGLSGMESRIIHERFIISSSRRPRTLDEVGRSVGLSPERVRQIEKRCLSKIRGAVEQQFAGRTGS